MGKLVRRPFFAADEVPVHTIKTMEAKPGDVLIYEPRGINHQFVVGFRTSNPKTGKYEPALTMLCVEDSGGLVTKEVCPWFHGDKVTFEDLLGFHTFTVPGARVAIVRGGNIIKPETGWFTEGMTVIGVDAGVTGAQYVLYAPNRIHRPKGDEWYTLGPEGAVDFRKVKSIQQFERLANQHSRRLRDVEFFDNVG